MESAVRTFQYENGECQRVQAVTLDRWEQLRPLLPPATPEALDRFADIYRLYLIPACPWLFGSLVLFRLPPEVDLPLPMETKGAGKLSQRLTAAAAVLGQGLRFRGDKPVFRTPEARQLWQALTQRDCVRVVKGKLPTTQVIPVEDAAGYLTEAAPEAAMKVNCAFFIMDPFDCATVYDHVGACIGLLATQGRVERPPQYDREALLVRKNGAVSIETPRLEDMPLTVAGKEYRIGVNARVYTRPQRRRTPGGKGLRLVIVGDRVVAVKQGGSVAIPASGFVLCPHGDCAAAPGAPVVYGGMEDVVFGIQVGNSILRKGQPTLEFRSPFYNIRHLEPVPYPPSLYPMDFQKARAARIALGADAQGRPMVLWIEGRGKLRYTPGKDSCGASLLEMAELCSQMGMVDGVNLDGGGSAQLLVHGQRSLRISDRNAADDSDSQRPVPMGLAAWE